MRQPGRATRGRRIPGLLSAFYADPQAYKENNGYIISIQVKPPDFVLETASPRTAGVDITDKCRDYAALGIPECWRFDETGRRDRKVQQDQVGRRPAGGRPINPSR